MPISIEEAQAFILDAAKSMDNWLTMADKSWAEIKKRTRNNKIWSLTPNSVSRRNRYPAWFSIFKIRQPLLLSRVGIPIGKDTTQDGRDNIGATAAMLLERLAVNLARSFDFFDVMSSARDDFLATNFAQVRGYYEREEIKQKVKEYIQPQAPKDPQSPEGATFVDGNGDQIEEQEIGQDDTGYFIEHSQIMDVENERICLEPVLYKDIRVDPNIRRWPRCKRLAFKFLYSRREFQDIFGMDALKTIPEPDKTSIGYNEATPKLQMVSVWEYWDEYDKDTYWFVDSGTDFITPKGYLLPEEQEENDCADCNGLYDLEKFFPTPPPLIMNSPTDEFWPVPEYYQLIELIEDISTIFSQMISLTRAIRPRLLFDNNVEGLQEALNEAASGDAFGVPNLAQSLVAAGGSLENVVQYIPVQQMVEALNNLYTALDNRLNSLYRLTGTSDMLQGLAQDQTQRTFGERQMTEKYALNQLAEPQRKMQEFVRDSYQLMCEMALKNFKDESLDQYIIPQTLPDDHQQRYKAALGMLKEDTKRFRVELETDSTIALNEEYDKQIRTELVNTLTAAIEKTAATAANSPALVKIELHAMKYLIQGFRQGKMFQGEITEAIDNVIKQAEEASKNAPPPFNKDEVAAQQKGQEMQASAQQAQQAAQLKQFEIQTTNQTKQYEIQTNSQIEMAKLQQASQMALIQNQLDQYKLQATTGAAQADLQFKYNELSANIGQAMQDLAAKREVTMVELRKISDKQDADMMQLQVDAQFNQAQVQLDTAKLQLDQADQAISASGHQLDQQAHQAMLQERWATEARLEQELKLAQAEVAIKAAAVSAEVHRPPEQPAPNITIQAPAPVNTEKSVSIKKDKFGGLKSFQSKDKTTPVKGTKK